MVSSGQVNGNWSSIQSILSKYNSEITGLSSNWQGPSFDSINSKAQDFVSEYTGAIGGQMTAFATACDLYEQYKAAKENLEITKNNYNAAVSNNDSANISNYRSQMTQLSNQCNQLKTQIESNLKTAASPQLTATSGTYAVTATGSKSSSSKGEDTATGSKGSDTTTAGTSSGSGTTGSVAGSSAGAVAGGTAGAAASGYVGAGSSAGTAASSSGGTVSVAKTENVDYGDLNMSNYPTGSSREDGIARATLVAKYLVENGGFTKEQAAALAGVYVDENNCDPGSYMGAEKNGQGASGTGGSGYGAGIGSWTFADYKNQCLNDAGYASGTPIESLSLQQQCDMIIATSQKSNKKYYDALKRCDNIEDASATAVVMTGGVGFSSNWDTHPTPAEAKAISDYYGRANDARFGASEYHWNADQRRLAIAKDVYQNL